jgi:uncharacterized RDD family membrane protein YckC
MTVSTNFAASGDSNVNLDAAVGLATSLSNPLTESEPVLSGRVPDIVSDQVSDQAASDVSADATEHVLDRKSDSANDPVAYAGSESWRVEVAARLERYRVRRKPRSPRYPSLLLPFDSPEGRSRSASPRFEVSQAVGTSDLTEPDLASEPLASPSDLNRAEAPDSFEARWKSSANETEHYSEPPQEIAKVIEFPRSAVIPVSYRSDLADPICQFDRPRIVEAPEILPPPPALGGMLIEPVLQEQGDRHELVFASPPASIGRRALAALADGAIVITSAAAFATIVFRLNPGLAPISGVTPSRGSLLALAALVAMIALLLGAIYEFLFIVYSGSTLGLRAAGLQLTTFDGSPLSRRSRRWRVLASFLSACSAGLGYLWCLIDQNGLCWHDRITRTHIGSLPPVKPS